MSFDDPFSDDYDPSLDEQVSVGMCNECSDLVWGPHMINVLEKLNGRKILVMTLHGSHLYGLSHANSDIDAKGVFLPTREEILLGRVPKVIKYNSSSDSHKNTKDDVDIEFYSLHHFFKLLCEGDTGAISMLYAPFTQTCSQHEMWQYVLDNKEIFLSKDMAGLIGFVRTQVNKYCIKGQRLAAVNQCIEVLERMIMNGAQDISLRDNWHILPFGRHIEMVNKNNQIFWEVCGRCIQDTCSTEYAYDVVLSIKNSYGKRAREAENNNGVDWKAVSHAFRVASELTDLYESGMIHYPLKDAEQIKRIKMGELDFDTEVLPDLNSLMDRVHEMSQKSDFPDSVDRKVTDSLLLNLIKSSMGGVL